MSEHDPVNHPRHYTEHPSGVECITITEHMGFNLGNAIKYIWRADLKSDAIEDLRKAAWYLQREINRRAFFRTPTVTIAAEPAATDTLEWIKWHGDILPPACRRVAVTYRNGTISENRAVSSLDWRQHGYAHDIVAYRMID